MEKETGQLTWYQWYNYTPEDIYLVKEHIARLEGKLGVLKKSDASEKDFRRVNLVLNSLRYTYGL